MEKHGITIQYKIDKTFHFTGELKADRCECINGSPAAC